MRNRWIDYLQIFPNFQPSILKAIRWLRLIQLRQTVVFCEADECIDIPNLQNIDSPIVFEEARLLSIESKVFDVFSQIDISILLAELVDKGKYA